MKRVPVGQLAQNVLRLPRLPIPTLAATAERYHASLVPLKSGEALTQHLTKLDSFLKDSAPVLQKRLSDGDDASIASKGYPYSYIEELVDSTILNSRAPLEVHMNTSFILKKGIVGTDNTQIGVAAAFVHGVATWVKEAIEKGVEVRDPNFDISPLLSEFGRSLIPSKERDVIFTTPLEKLRHVIVLHDGHPYLVNIFDEHQNVLDRALIQRAFELIISITPDQDNTTAVAVLTAASRALWGQAYQELLKTPENAETLRLFHEGALVVCLDSKEWNDNSNIAELSALHGSSEELENRWYDKHQLIVSADGQVAFNFEPTDSDRMHWSRWIGDVLGRVASDNRGAIDTSNVDAAELTKTIQHLKITFGKSFAGHIRTARQEALVLVEDTEVHSLHIPYGRDALAALGVDPNAFVQMCLQTAQYHLRERLSATSQLCSTARFFHGTTDTVRATTTEALRLAECVAALRKANAASASSGAPAEGGNAATPAPTKESMGATVKAACARHTALLNSARAGEGIDRHLMALKNVAHINGDKVALAFFEDELYKSSSTFFLNTSEFSTPWLRYYSFGPALSSGYGVGYVIDGSEIRMCISAFTNSPATNAADLMLSILSSADSLYQMLAGK